MIEPILALFNDRLVLGMKGTMPEAELHILRACLDGGIRNTAACGELRRGLPVGLVWGEADGEILLHPDQAVTGVITAIFKRFAVAGSVRAVWLWLWLRDQGLRFPLQPTTYLHGTEIVWVEPTYHAVHTVLTHWAAPRFPDKGISVSLCSELLIQILVVHLLRGAVAQG